jgi:tRNA(Ile)-lysidine synthase TilS/MesJ
MLLSVVEKIPREQKIPLSKFSRRLVKKVGKACSDYGLINDRDRIMVAVSGGKDSLTLLKILQLRQTFVPIKYDLLACHVVEKKYNQCAQELRETLEKFFRENGAEFHFEEIVIPDTKNDAACFWCSWNRRKAIFQAAQRLGCNKIAFGHHLDDIIATHLLNLFYQGEISTMPVKLPLFDGKLTIIRPLAYLEEKETTRFAKEFNFPKDLYVCAHSLTSKRKLVTDFIRQLEKDCPEIKTNIFRSLKRIRKEYLL